MDTAALAQINAMLYPAEPSNAPAVGRPKIVIKRRRIPHGGGEGCGFWGTCEESRGVCGNGVVEWLEDCDDGNTADGDGCSSMCRVEIKLPQVTMVAPDVLRRLWVSGDTWLRPKPAIRMQMRRHGRTSTIWAVRLCLSPDGRVASARMLMSSRDDEFDAAILSAIRSWRYRPYTLRGSAVPVCSAVVSNHAI